MELEKVTAEIRPRTQWEAIDLGISLVREHIGALFKGWMASVYPLGILILVFFLNVSVFWGCFLIWWLKPVWERVALHPLSRSLFGEHPTWKETMRVLPAQLRAQKILVVMGVAIAVIGAGLSMMEDETSSRGFMVLLWLTIVGLLFYRSVLSRSLSLPVRYLEGLDGARSKARVQVLSYRSSSSAMGLTVICILMEVLLFGSQVWFVLMMLPEGVMPAESESWEAYGEGVIALPDWIKFMLAVFYLNAMSVVAWFYTGGGFGLYVNTRTWTEGWDIELKFKSLGQRFGVVILALGLVGAMPQAESNQEANQDAQRILDSPDFDVGTRDVYEDKEDTREYIEGDGDLFAGVGQLLFWIILMAAVVGLIWLIAANAHLFRKGGPKEREKEERKKVTTVAGMNVEPENLPSDLVGTARKLWEEGRFQEALGLLYRGAISSLVSRQEVEIEECDTEMDCLRRVKARGEGANANYFQLLTKAWMSQAYARRRPDDETVEQLWAGWPFSERSGR